MNWVMKKLRAHRTELCLSLGALLLYVPAITWGLPNATGPELTHPWGPDDIAPLGPLAEFHNTFVEAKADRFLAYPLMHYWLVGIAYAPYVLYLLATGGLSNPTSTFPYGLADPVHSLRVLSLIARSVTLLMAVGTVVAAYHVARSLWDHTRGLLAGVFVMLLYPMFYYSRTGNLDVPALFWGSVGLVVYARILREGYSVWRGIWLGVFAAMSAGTKDQGAGLFLLMPLVLLPLHFRRMARERTDGPQISRWRAPATTLVAGLLVYLVSSGFIFRPERYFAHMAFITGMGQDGHKYFGHPATWEGYKGLLRESFDLLAAMMTNPVLTAALLGVFMATLRDRQSLALLVPGISLLATVILPVRYVEMRFLLPVAFVLACFAAYPLGGALLSRRAPLRVASVFLTLGMCATPLLYGIDLTYAMIRDSRYDAAEWLNIHLRPGDRVEFFGPHQKLPRLMVNVKVARAVEFKGTDRSVRYTPAQIQSMAADIAERSPNFILVIPDHSSSSEFPYGTTCPDELYDLLRDGSLGYRLAAQFETSPIFVWVQRPPLDYPAVNPAVHIFVRAVRHAGMDFTLTRSAEDLL